MWGVGRAVGWKLDWPVTQVAGITHLHKKKPHTQHQTRTRSGNLTKKNDLEIPHQQSQDTHNENINRPKKQADTPNYVLGRAYKVAAEAP